MASEIFSLRRPSSLDSTEVPSGSVIDAAGACPADLRLLGVKRAEQRISSGIFFAPRIPSADLVTHGPGTIATECRRDARVGACSGTSPAMLFTG